MTPLLARRFWARVSEYWGITLLECSVGSRVPWAN